MRVLAALVFSAGLFQAGLGFAGNGTVVYTYDTLGRLASARYDPGFIIVYTYDANGNRLSQTINFNSNPLSWTSTIPPCTSNCWGSTNWNSLTWTPEVPPCTTNCWGNALWKN